MKFARIVAMFCIGLSLAQLVPSNANAVVMATSGKMKSSSEFVGSSVLCVLVASLVFPVGLVCVLDEKSDGFSDAAAADLAANGYSQEQIQTIQQDQAALVGALKQNKAQLQISQNDTAESISSEIQGLVPGVSQIYVDYMTSSMGLK
jgi:hypothetical protein